MEKGILMTMDNKKFFPVRACSSWHSRNRALELLQSNHCHKHHGNLWKVPRRIVSVGHSSNEVSQVHFTCARHPSYQQQPSWRICATSINLEDEPSLLSKESYLMENDEGISDDSSEKLVVQRRSSDELKAILADSERSKLVRKLSEANQQNRFLKRQLLSRDDTLINFKSELAILELELQTLVGLAEEVAKSGNSQSSRKINGKYVPSYLLSRLEAIHEKIKEQIKGVDAVKVRDVELFWYGMAEIVQVMGSFDGWSQGEQLSPEYNGGFTKFSTVLKLRPGRYEIKFVVDDQWQLSPELPVIGEGLTQNNLLIVQ